MEEIPDIFNERKEEILNRLDQGLSYARKLNSDELIELLQDVEKLIEELN